jgi:AFG3 family protein
MPRERFLYTVEQLQDRMCMTLGGRVAEQLKFGVMSTGAQDDLQKITKQVYAQITRYGMNEKLGLASFNVDDSGGNYQRPYSEKTASLIDSEARRMVAEAYGRTEELLRSKMAQLEALAAQLLEKEVLKADDLVALLGERPFGARGSHDELAQQMLREAEERLARDHNRKD